MLIESHTDPWIQMDNGICVVLGFLGRHDGSNELWYSIDPATQSVYKLTDMQHDIYSLHQGFHSQGPTLDL